MAQQTEHETPPMETSDEANAQQLEFAREQGSAYERALKHMAREEAHDGGEIAAGNYVIAYAVEKAEGMYALEDGTLEWQEPGDANVHVEVSVRDGADGRFVPGLTVKVTLVDEDGNEVGTHEQPFLWHPWLHHYGRNWKVPGDGKYTMRVRVDPPTFMRHDKKNGLRYAEPVDVAFEGVKIKTGRK